MTLKQVQALTPDQIEKMTQSERARALTTVQDVMKKRVKRAAEKGIDLPGLKNYDFVSTRGMSKEELKKQLEYATQAVSNKTASIQGVQKVEEDTWKRIKEMADYEQLDEEPENPFNDPDFKKDFWDTYDKIKDRTQGFGSEWSWKSDTLQAYIMKQKYKGKSSKSIVRSGRQKARQWYEEEQRREAEINKEMEPWGDYGNNSDLIDIDGEEDLFDL